MTEHLLNGAALMLQSIYPNLTADKLKVALDGVAEDGGSDLTVKETAEQLKMCRASIYNLIAGGKLESYKIGAATRIRRASVELLIAAGTASEPGEVE